MTVQSQSKQGTLTASRVVEMVACPRCGVAANIDCISLRSGRGRGGGRPVVTPHEKRWEIAREALDRRSHAAKQGEGTRVSVWRLVSCYSDGDRIVEATFDQREDAERMIPRVYEFRSDQTEAPVDVVVEEAPWLHHGLGEGRA